MIFIAGITIAFFLEFLLLSKKNKSEADIILAIWMFFIGVHQFLYYLHYAGLYTRFPFFIGVIMPLPLIHGPFLYIYVSRLTSQIPRRAYLQYLHFLPPVLVYIYLISFLALPASEKIRVIESGGAGYEVFSAINLALICISGVIYVLLSQLKLQQHKKKIREQFSDVEKITLSWLQYLIFGIAFIWIVVLGVNLMPFDIFKNIETDILIYIAVAIFVAFLGFFGLRQTTIFAHQVSNSQHTNGINHSMEVMPETGKYIKSGLRPAEADQLHKKLTEYMIHEKPYLDSQLSLAKLSSNFGVHTNYISQVINEKEGMNFYDYINTYRVNEFKRLVTDPRYKRLTILALAMECGFNSKSAFNGCFKKLTNQTPSEFLKIAE